MRRELLLDDPDRASFPRKRESMTWIPAFAGMTKRNGFQARLAWNFPSCPLSPLRPFDTLRPFDKLKAPQAQGPPGEGPSLGRDPAMKKRELYPRRSRRRLFLVIPLRLPAPVRPPSSFRRKPESRGHLSPRPRLSPGRRAGAPLRKPISVLWIPAFMGMTTGWDLQGGNSPQKTPNRDTRNFPYPLYSGTDHSPLTT